MADFEDLPYRHINGTPLLARLYRAARSRAVVIEVHGGAWAINDRTSNVAIHQYLAAHGISVFAIDFRMAPAHQYPAAVEDVNYAVRWLKANAARLGVPGPIGGVGTSSGAHLLAASSLQPGRFANPKPTLEGGDASIAFLVAAWPILDPLARYRMAQAKGLARLVDAHHAFWPDERAMSDGSPQGMVERGEAASLPPMLILQGTADQNVEHEAADRFATVYRLAGGEVEVVKFKDQPHSFIPQTPDAPESVQALHHIVQFVEARC
jgi:acetyl esterase/lipase